MSENSKQARVLSNSRAVPVEKEHSRQIEVQGPQGERVPECLRNWKETSRRRGQRVNSLCVQLSSSDPWAFPHSFKLFAALNNISVPERTIEVSLLSGYLCVEGYRSANVETALLLRVQRFLWRLRRYMLGHFFNTFHFFLRTFLPFPR